MNLSETEAKKLQEIRAKNFGDEIGLGDSEMFGYSMSSELETLEDYAEHTVHELSTNKECRDRFASYVKSFCLDQANAALADSDRAIGFYLNVSPEEIVSVRSELSDERINSLVQSAAIGKSQMLMAGSARTCLFDFLHYQKLDEIEQYFSALEAIDAALTDRV